eukprot:scaffold5267_cov135-Skeletonema_marinoi.AAC.9
MSNAKQPVQAMHAMEWSGCETPSSHKIRKPGLQSYLVAGLNKMRVIATSGFGEHNWEYSKWDPKVLKQSSSSSKAKIQAT